MTVRDRLIAARKVLAPEVRAELLSLGADAVPEFLAVFSDASLLEGDSGGWASIYAAECLCELRSEAALPALLKELTEGSWDDYLHDRLLQHLPKYGAALVEPALALISADEIDVDVHDSVVCVLAECGVRDQRIFEEILAQLTDDLVMGAHNLANYGDPAGLPIIRAAIEDFEPDLKSMHDRINFRELIDAFRILNGSVPADIRELGDAVEGAYVAANAPKPEKVGRNDSCPCGSGLKFKKCCLGKAA